MQTNCLQVAERFYGRTPETKQEEKLLARKLPFLFEGLRRFEDFENLDEAEY